MWYYVIGCIVSFIILIIAYYIINRRITYGMLFQIALLSIFSWISVLFEVIIMIVAIIIFAIFTPIMYLSETKFWNKEIFKKK